MFLRITSSTLLSKEKAVNASHTFRECHVDKLTTLEPTCTGLEQDLNSFQTKFEGIKILK